MSAGRYDIILEQGSTFDLPIRYATPSGSLVDLTGYTARMQVREAPGTAVITEFTSSETSNGFIWMSGTAAERSDGQNGNVRLYMSSANTSVLPKFRGQYDLELVDPEGYTVKLLAGKFTIEPEITR